MFRKTKIRKQEDYLSKFLRHFDELKCTSNDVRLNVSRIIKAAAGSLLNTDYKVWLEKCTTQQDWQGLNNAIFQQTHYKLFPGLSAGYDHSTGAPWILWAFACGDWDTMERTLPRSLGLSKAGYPFHVVMSNLLMAIWYNDSDLLEAAMPKAKEFTSTKAPRWERAAVAFTIALNEKQAEQMSLCLQDMCTGYSKVDLSSQEGYLCVPAHGLYCLAHKLLTRDVFLKIEMPEHESFLQQYARWRIANPMPENKLYFEYPAPAEIVNRIYMLPVATSIIMPLYPNSKVSQIWLLDQDQMLEVMSNECVNTLTPPCL